MNQLKPPENGHQSRIRTNSIRFACWSGAWLAANGVDGIRAAISSVMDRYHVIPFHAEISHLLDSHESDVCGVRRLRLGSLPMKNRLKVLRAERNWTQAQLADALDVSRQTINAIETGLLRDPGTVFYR
jgi:Helix-turn-helix